MGWLKPGTKANDYRCPNCQFWFQLKSQKSRIGSTVTDGAYGAMMDAIREDRSPNFFFLHYDLTTWSVRNLLLVPHFAFPPSAIIKRKPLSATARRAGWVGCNFDLKRIPVEARIVLIVTPERSAPVPGAATSLANDDSRQSSAARFAAVAASGDGRAPATIIAAPNQVRAQFRKLKPLQEVSLKDRGWMLDVLNIVHRLREDNNPSIFGHVTRRFRSWTEL